MIQFSPFEPHHFQPDSHIGPAFMNAEMLALAPLAASQPSFSAHDAAGVWVGSGGWYSWPDETVIWGAFSPELRRHAKTLVLFCRWVIAQAPRPAVAYVDPEQPRAAAFAAAVGLQPLTTLLGILPGGRAALVLGTH